MPPRCLPPDPDWRPNHPGDAAERLVWEALVATLPDEAVVLHGVAVLDGGEERELDLVVLWPGFGLAVIEVKAGQLACRDRQWTQSGREIRDPVEQASTARHVLLRYIKQHTSIAKLRSIHLVGFPNTKVPADWRSASCPRRLVIAAEQMSGAADQVREALVAHGTGSETITGAQVEALEAALAGQLGGQTSLLTAAEEHDQRVDLLTREQYRMLDNLANWPRLRVIGGAGSGKTWLAMEQARRLARSGKRTALLCYSRGLARFLERETAGWPKRERPEYVGLFHQLAVDWGAPEGADDDSNYWEHQLPTELGVLARGKPVPERFDAVVVDEAQDFGDAWWPSLLDCLRDRDESGLYVFLDEAQRVFQRQGEVPIPLPPYALTENVRNTKRIAQVFGSLGVKEQKHRGATGEPVTFVSCATDDAVEAADDAIDALLDEGWGAGQIALLTTQRRHPEQVAQVELHGYAGYWDGFFAGDGVFYGHILGFKGLERPAVVLAVNGFRDMQRAKEMLYVGLSRARSRLVVCGDLDLITEVGGLGVRKRLTTSG